MITFVDDQLMVELGALHRPQVRRALEATIEGLNAMESKLIGAGAKLVFSLKR